MKINLDKYEAKARVTLNEQNLFESKFEFLNEHNGFRKGKLHVLIGNTGSGKSTLIKSIVLDQLNRGKKVLLWLSEESIDDFITDVSYMYSDDYKWENLTVFSELDTNEKIQDVLSAQILDNKPDLFVYDNITTSKYYNDKAVPDQGVFTMFIKQFFKKYDIPCLVVAHTSSTSNQRVFINETHIRGSKTISNIAEFFYTIEKYPFERKTDGRQMFLQYVRVIKHRGQRMKSMIFVLKFSKETKLFEKDLPVNSLEFDNLIKNTKREFV